MKPSNVKFCEPGSENVSRKCRPDSAAMISAIPKWGSSLIEASLACRTIDGTLNAHGLRSAGWHAYRRGQATNLKRARFLRLITKYPVIYQVTRSAVRLIARDSSARRSHVTATIQARLLAVSFYHEATEWPAQFVFDHEEKIAAFHNAGCPATALPQRAGEPYLWEEFVLPFDTGISVAMIDHTHRRCFWQALGFVRRFAPALKVLKHRLGLMIVIGSETRYRTYSRLVHHRALKKAAEMELDVFLSPYLVQGANLTIPQLIWPAQAHPEEFDDADLQPLNNNNVVRGRLSAPAGAQ